MATLTIRKLDDQVYGRLRERALANKRSLEAEVRHILERETAPAESGSNNLEAFFDRLRVRHEEFVAAHGYMPDSTPLIRQMREEE